MGKSDLSLLRQFLRKYEITIPHLLLQEALTHPSVREYDSTIKSNEQLETLGDAVLDLLVGHQLIKQNPEIESGELTQYRSSLVNNKTLAKLGDQIGIDEILWVADGYSINVRDIANAIEAIFGAIFLDEGYPATEKFFQQIFPDMEETADINPLSSFPYHNPIGELQEFTQKRKIPLPVYKIIEQTGPDHNPEFTMQCTLNYQNKVISETATGSSKKMAREKVAVKILNILSQ